MRECDQRDVLDNLIMIENSFNHSPEMIFFLLCLFIVSYVIHSFAKDSIGIEVDINW